MAEETEGLLKENRSRRINALYKILLQSTIYEFSQIVGVLLHNITNNYIWQYSLYLIVLQSIIYNYSQHIVTLHSTMYDYLYCWNCIAQHYKTTFCYNI